MVGCMAPVRILQWLHRRDRDAQPGTRQVVRAVWKGAVVAESDRTIVVEGNHYFPPESIRKEHLVPSDAHTSCPWKGQASYYSIRVGQEINRDAAWHYPNPSPAASRIAGYVAFWRGVSIERETASR